MKFCEFCQTSINDAEETACPSLNYAIDTCCPWLPDDRKVKPAANGNPYIPGTYLALAYDAGFNAAVEQRRQEDAEDESYPARAARAMQKLKDSGGFR